MSFNDLIIKTQTVKLSDKNSVELRGLSTTDILLLANEYEDVIALLFDSVDFKDQTKASKTLIARAPALAYLAISLAADEPEAAETIAKLPIPLQVELVKVVYDLTFPGGKKDVKKLASVLSALLKS